MKLKLGLLAACFAALVPDLALGQEEPAPLAISGQVINGTSGGAAAEGLRVQVVAFTDERSLGSWEATTGATGHFAVDGVIADDRATYVVGTEYAGVSYVDRLQRGDDGGVAPVNLNVYESAPLDPGIRFDRSAFIVSAVDAERQTIKLTEVHSLSNPTDRTFLPQPDGAGGPSGLLVFGLPMHAFGLSPHLGLNAESVIQIDRGFASLDPVRPGKTEIAFSYEFPFSQSSYIFRRTLRYPVDSLRVLVPAEGPRLLAEDGLPAVGRVSLGDRAYQELHRAPLAAGDNLSVTLDELPARPALSVPVPVGPEPIGAVGAVAGALAVLAIWWRGRGGVAVEPTDDQILDALVALDLDRAAGKIPEVDYVAERERLLSLTHEPST